MVPFLKLVGFILLHLQFAIRVRVLCYDPNAAQESKSKSSIDVVYPKTKTERKDLVTLLLFGVASRF
jgi:hypothetical protein